MVYDRRRLTTVGRCATTTKYADSVLRRATLKQGDRDAVRALD